MKIGSHDTEMAWVSRFLGFVCKTQLYHTNKYSRAHEQIRLILSLPKIRLITLAPHAWS